MAVSYSRQIPPGGMGEVTLKVKTDGKAGKKISQHATVYTDDPNQATLQLTLTGEVIPAAKIHPKVARLVGKAGDTIQTDVIITPQGTNKFDIRHATARDGSHIQFKIEKKIKSEPQEFILHISNTEQAPGRYFDKITLTTTSAISPEITIRVFGLIRDK